MMTSKQFVDLLRLASVETLRRWYPEKLRKPPGKKPPPDDVAMSDWYNRLTDADRMNIDKIIADVSLATLVHVLDVFDGVDQIEPLATRGKLEIMHVDPEGNVSRFVGPASQWNLRDLL